MDVNYFCVCCSLEIIMVKAELPLLRLSFLNMYFILLNCLPPFLQSSSCVRTQDTRCHFHPEWILFQPWRPYKWHKRSTHCAKPRFRKPQNGCFPGHLFLLEEFGKEHEIRILYLFCSIKSCACKPVLSCILAFALTHSKHYSKLKS